MFEKEINGKKIVSIFYYLTNFLMIIPFCLRFQRIVKCCEIKKDERVYLQELYSKRYLYQENYYLKFTLIVFSILTLILIISDVVIKFKDTFSANFLFESKDNNLKVAKSILWQAINFVEHMILLTFVYKICANQLKQKLRFEIILMQIFKYDN